MLFYLNHSLNTWVVWKRGRKLNTLRVCTHVWDPPEFQLTALLNVKSVDLNSFTKMVEDHWSNWKLSCQWIGKALVLTLQCLHCLHVMAVCHYCIFKQFSFSCFILHLLVWVCTKNQTTLLNCKQKKKVLCFNCFHFWQSYFLMQLCLCLGARGIGKSGLHLPGLF